MAQEQERDPVRVKRNMWLVFNLIAWLSVSFIPDRAAAEDPLPQRSDSPSQSAVSAAATQPGSAQTGTSLWHYGGFLDLAYPLDFNYPGNHTWRFRSTTPQVNDPVINMGAAYVRKDATIDSRWGMELLAQGGEDSKTFGFETNLPEVSHADVWRHFGRANASYLAPVGNGLTLQAGLFNSFVGYDSLYAKDNPNYTRAWIADYSPYLMFGANAQYSFNEQWSGAFFIINGYFHLSSPNSLPSYGGQVTYTPTKAWTVRQTLYYGPDQSETNIEFWRLFSDTIIEWKSERLTVALDYQAGTQKNASVPGNRRELFTGADLTIRYHLAGPWSVALRPEFYSDASGVITGSEQFIKAITTTLQYRLPYQWTNTICRLEYRYDDSTGSGGGFYKGTGNSLTPGQNLLIFSVIGTFASP
jgi:hypothetical protein